MPVAELKTHSLDRSGLYGLKGLGQLAEMLFISRTAMETLANSKDRYQSWDEPKKSGGFRRIEAPHDNLKAVQKRLSEILQRITAPAYLMAPVKRRSYVHNAAAHKDAKAFQSLDIEDFFPSCTDKRVFWFFHKGLRCAKDVAAILTKLTTENGHLPQGSPCSPILAFFAYLDMWETINRIVEAAGCRLTIYADDITISGLTVPQASVWSVKQTLVKFGHRYNKRKERSIIGKPADITGVIVSGGNILLPNRQHHKLSEARRNCSSSEISKDRILLSRQLRGREAQAKQILNHVIQYDGNPIPDQS